MTFGYKKEYRGFSFLCLPGLNDGFYLLKDFVKELDKIYKKNEWYRYPVISSLAVTCVRRELYLDVEKMIQDKQIINGEDTLRIFALIFVSSSIYIIRKGFYHYRMHEESISHQKNKLNLHGCVALGQEMKRLLDRKVLLFPDGARQYFYE